MTGGMGWDSSGGPASWSHRCLSFQAWKVHLMGPVGCAMNLRRTRLLFKAAVPLQGEDGPGRVPHGHSARRQSPKQWPRSPCSG